MTSDAPMKEPNEAERLRRENEELRRQIEELRAPAAAHGALWGPSATTIWAIFLFLTVLTVVAFLAGYLPLQKRQALLASEVREQEHALPRVDVIEVGRGKGSSELELPGSIQAITEAPILARADGYVQRRLVDIGDRVRAGQPLAEIEAPEMAEQIRQAKAAVQQTQAAIAQALANLKQGEADTELARITAQRYANLTGQGVVSKQDNDTYQARYQSLVAQRQSLEQAIAVQRGNAAAAEASLSRLEKLESYLIVKAPFDGVITQRNVDTGALVNSGNTLLFRMAQTATLRLYVNVPQSQSASVRAGEAAHLSVSSLPGREFHGVVARTANALDPATRTLLVEIHVPNPDGALLPGMYARVALISLRPTAPLVIPSEAMIVRAQGSQVAVVAPDGIVHLQKIEVGRDYGDHIEVRNGLREGDLIIPNPGDVAREGAKVEPVRKVQ